MTRINELKAQIYDEILKKTVAERNIAILEQQLHQEIPKDPQPALALAEKPVEPVPHNNT